jgi:hypothetical protein
LLRDILDPANRVIGEVSDGATHKRKPGC